jgi:hypothetical protein
MTNLVKIDLVELDIIGKNYLSWVLDAEIHLDVMGFGGIIKHENEASNKKKGKDHRKNELKIEYLTIKYLLVLWQNLKERIDH